MDDDPSDEKPYPVSTAKLSKTPSWIMLGFLLGAAFVVALPPFKRPAPPPPPERERPEPQEPARPPAPPQISRIEAVFTAWQRYAIWAPDDTTQVALWNGEQRDFTEFYEVLRSGGEFYFRSLPRLTRRIMTRGNVPRDCPLHFTETEEQYRAWTERNTSSPPPVSRPRYAAPRAPPAETFKVEPRTETPRAPALEAPGLVQPPRSDP